MHKVNGFTWMDLIVSLCIFAILCQFISPFGRHFYQRHRLATIADSLAQSIAFARTSAQVSGDVIVLTPIDADWSEGVVIQQAKKRLRQSEWHLPGLTITWYGFRSRHALIFSADLAQSTANGHFCLCISSLGCKRLVVNRLGHVTQDDKFMDCRPLASV